LKDAGYRTGYIGKWHLDGPQRKGFTPPGPRRQGFDYWAVANCDHDYMNSHYYRDLPQRLKWPGYDAKSQTDLAIDFVSECGANPFALFLSWGPPHNPYNAVEQRFLDLYPPERVPVRPNCPKPNMDDLRGYYAHVSALDEQIGRLLKTLRDNQQLENTIFVFTSDHGDMLGSHGQQRKQRPWEESINVPFLIRSPMQFAAGKNVDTLLNVWDIMPTLLSLLGIAVPPTVEGSDLSAAVLNSKPCGPDATLASIIAPFAEYVGLPWRAVRTHQHTYVRDINGPWLLYDNQRDPYQLQNLVGLAEHANLQSRLERRLNELLARFGDEFLPAAEYHRRWGYIVNRIGAIEYTNE
jgi:arylsulfatase A-like enzyme